MQYGFLFAWCTFMLFLSHTTSNQIIQVQSTNTVADKNVHHPRNDHESHGHNKRHNSEEMMRHKFYEEQLDSPETIANNQEGPRAFDDKRKVKETSFKHNKHTQRQRKKQRKMKLLKSKARARESAWYYCADESIPKDVKVSSSSKGVMCSKEYPAHTCCSHHDLTMELIGSQIAERVPDVRCARFLMKLRCAHCSPRSWWLFHAPDKRRHPHKRVMPILCLEFCKKFHSACRDSIQGLQNDNFCEFHTSNEAGPCFPDYEIRQGTID